MPCSRTALLALSTASSACRSVRSFSRGAARPSNAQCTGKAGFWGMIANVCRTERRAAQACTCPLLRTYHIGRARLTTCAHMCSAASRDLRLCYMCSQAHAQAPTMCSQADDLLLQPPSPHFFLRSARGLGQVFASAIHIHKHALHLLASCVTQTKWLALWCTSMLLDLVCCLKHSIRRVSGTKLS